MVWVCNEMLNGNKKEQITATQNNMMNLIDIILSKRSKKQVYVLYDFIYMKLKKRQKIIDGQNRAGGGARGCSDWEGVWRGL